MYIYICLRIKLFKKIILGEKSGKTTTLCYSKSPGNNDW